MTFPIWYFAAGIPVLMSLGYLTGEIIAFTTTKELQAAWVLLAVRVQEFLTKCDECALSIDRDELAPLSEALQLLKDLNELPKSAAASAPADRWL